MGNSFLNKTGLSRFLENLYNVFSKIGHTHSKEQITDYNFDSVVLCEEQNFTEDEREQARKNIGAKGCKDLGEDPEFFDKLDSFVEEGSYKVSDGEFVYTVKIERPSEDTVGQTYWSTEEGIGTTYARTGWFDGENWSFNTWDAPLYSDNAHDIFSDKQHVHYLMKATDNFEEWIDKYTPGSFRVLDSTTEKYYYVSAEGYSAALNGRLRRYQSYFEATEPWKVYSRTGTAAVGNSGYITWDEWHCVDDVNKDKYVDIESDDVYLTMDELVEEGKYRISDGEFIYTVVVERTTEENVGQTYWSTEEGINNTFYRAGVLYNGSWEFSDWINYASVNYVSQNYTTKGHVHYTKTQTTDFAEWIDEFQSGSFRVFDSVAQKYYLIEQWSYNVTTRDPAHRAQEYFELSEPWKVYTRYGTAPANSSVTTWDEWHCDNQIFSAYDELGVITDLESSEVIDGLTQEGLYRFSDAEFTYSVVVERPNETQIAQIYCTTEEGNSRKYFRDGFLSDDGTWVLGDWVWHLTKDEGNALYAAKNHTHDFSELSSSAENVSDARENLSTIGFITGQYNTVEEFIEATTAAGNYSKVLQTAFRFKDLGGWCPLGIVNLWYQGFMTWQNNPSSTVYNVDAVILLWNGVNSTIYRGTVRGNYTNGLTLTWKQVFDSDATVPVASGGTGATTAAAARAKLGLNPVKLWQGNQNTGSLTFDYGPYQFYLIRGFVSGFIYSTIVVVAQEISTAVSSWCIPLKESQALVFKMNRVTETADDGTETRYVNLELDATNNTGSIMVVWGFN